MLSHNRANSRTANLQTDEFFRPRLDFNKRNMQRIPITKVHEWLHKSPRAIRRLPTEIIAPLLDRAVTYTFLWRVALAFSYAGTGLCVSRLLTPVLQGYYFAFDNLLSFRIVAELGLSTVILQWASHEAAGLSWTRDEWLNGSVAARQRLASLLSGAIRWYTFAAAIYALGLSVVGVLFFRGASNADTVIWRLPWIFSVGASAILIWLTPYWAFLEGCGRLAEAARARGVSTTVAAVSCWITMAIGSALWAIPASLIAQSITEMVLLGHYSGAIRQILKLPGDHNFSWRRDIWPFQIRLAISWIAGYCLFTLAGPVVFRIKGPVIAGQFGLTLMIVQAIVTFGVAIVKTKAPEFGRLIKLGSMAELVRKYRIARRTMLIFVWASVISVGFAVIELNRWNVHGMARLLPPTEFLILLSSAVLNSLSHAQGVFLRAFRQEPYLRLSVTIGLIAIPATFLSATYGSMTTVTLSYLLITGVGACVWSSYIFAVRVRAIEGQALRETPQEISLRYDA